MPQNPELRVIVQRMVDAGEPEEAIGAVIQRLSTSQPKPDQTPEPQRGAVSRFARGAGEMLNPVTMVKGVYQAVTNPIDTAGAIYDQQGQQFDKAAESFREGRYSEMAGHGLAAFLPVVGPLAADIGEQAGRGDVAGAAGRLAGGALAWQAPKLAKKIPARIGGAPTAERELARWGLDKGVPVDAPTATANPIPRAAQQLTTRTSVAGGMVGTKASKARQSALARVGDELADQGYAGAATKETAGAAARAGVETSIKGFDDAANQSYGTLRQIENANVKTVTLRPEVKSAITSDGRGGTILEPAITKQLSAPVDLRTIRPQLKPILDRLNRKRELTGQLMGDEGRAVTALDRLVNGEDFASLVDVDAALGDLKSMARGAAMPELRTGGQGTAAAAVKQLSLAVDDAAKQLGPEAVEALAAGRAATRQKYAAADVLDSLKAEPVRTANAAIAPQDAAVLHLRELQRYAPESLPQVGKAVLTDLLTEATKDGGFTSNLSIASKWQKMGPQTKALLYKDPAYIKDLDRFFALAKKMGEQSNPSGSAHVGGLMAQGYLLTDPVTLIGYQLAGGGLAKALNSPVVTRALVEGVQVPLKAKTVAAAKFSRLANLIEQATNSGASQTITPPPSRSQ